MQIEEEDDFAPDTIPMSPAQRLDRTADLETVLEAWHDATLRLEQTHATLQAEVCRLTDELEIKNRELARKNRLADLGQISSHVAHEVRNNLVPATLYMSLLRRRLSEDSGSLDILDKVSASFTTLDAMVNDLLHFAADRAPQTGEVMIRELVAEVWDSIAPQLQAQSIRTEIDVPEVACATADREMLRRAVLNLSLNALDAMPEGGDLCATSYDGGEGFELEIADSGCGLSDEAKRRAFEPFYSTKNTGTGLGLAIVYHILEVHGGRVTAMNCPEGGASFTLHLPAPARKAMAA